jgi:flagellar basal-body rod protein FlgF
MLKELYTAAIGMMPQQTRLEVIANNMANASTTGFKRDSVFERNLLDAKANMWNVPGDAEQDDPPIGTYVDYNQGAFEQTSNPLDLAIQDAGFFVVHDEEGKEFLTRDGHFKISEDGNLTAMDGKLLIGENGPINVTNEFLDNQNERGEQKATDIKINENGEVFANNKMIDKLLIANVYHTEKLQKISSADFVSTVDNNIYYLKPENTKIKQGWLESSNVNIISEMVQMIELQRGFEANSKVIHTNDGTLDNSIRMGRY